MSVEHADDKPCYNKYSNREKAENPIMNKPNLSSIVQLMRGAIDRMQREGTVTLHKERIVKLAEIFSFSPEDVTSVTYVKNAEGRNSVRFCVKNTKFFDDNGQLSENQT